PTPQTARYKHPPKHLGLLPRSLDNGPIDSRAHSTPGTLASSPQTPPPPLPESSRPVAQTTHEQVELQECLFPSGSIHPGFAGARRAPAKVREKFFDWDR